MSSNTVWPSNSTEAPESTGETRAAGASTESPSNSPTDGNDPESNIVSAQWAEARHAYPIYAALAKQSGITETPYPAGSSPAENPPPQVAERDLRWLDEMDAQIKAVQIRQLPPATLNANADALRAFIRRSLRKPEKSETDRDKIDFLVVQYFALCAPESLYHQEIAPQDVTRVLEPLLGNAEIAPLAFSLPLESILEASRECRSLRDLLERGLLEQGRLLKESSGDLFYDPAALVTFARFNFLMRRAFIQLLHADQNAVVKAIDELDRAGIHSVDCRRVGLSAAEPISQLRLFAENWRPLYHKDYSENAVNRSFEQLLALRTDLEEALAKHNAPSTVAETGLEAYGSPAAAIPVCAPENVPESASVQLDVAPANAHSPASQSAESDARTSVEQSTGAGNESGVESAADSRGRSRLASDAEAVEPTGVGAPSLPVGAAGATNAEPATASAVESGHSARLNASYALDAAAVNDSQAAHAENPEPLAPISAPATVPVLGTTGTESCMEAIWGQLIAAPPSRGRSMSTVVLKNTKVLLSSWEVGAFVTERGLDAEDLRRAVVARAMISVAMDARKQTAEVAPLTSALEKARSEVSYFQGRVEQAKRAKNTEAAVNLGISTKRLLSFIEEAEKLVP